MVAAPRFTSGQSAASGSEPAQPADAQTDQSGQRAGDSGQLNSQSTQGAWLLPQANTPVELQTQLGKLRLSLSHVEEASGSRANLNIRSTDDKPVPALSARGMGRNGSRQRQAAERRQPEPDHYRARQSDAAQFGQRTAATQRAGTGQPGYVRVHDVQAVTDASTVVAGQ